MSGRPGGRDLLLAALLLAGPGLAAQGCGALIGVGVSASLLAGGSGTGGGASRTPVPASPGEVGPLAPRVDSISPPAGSHRGGLQVTIAGAGFPTGDPPPTVTIGGMAAADVVVQSGGVLTATLPPRPGPGKVDVVVTGPASGSGTLAGGFTYTNALPRVTLTDLDSPQSGNVVLTLTVHDEEADPVDLELELSSDGGASYRPIAPGEVPSGGLAGLASDPAGLRHRLTWDTRASLPGRNAAGVLLRATPIDRSDGQRGEAGVCAPFDITNNGPPTLEVIQPGRDAYDVVVAYRVSDPDGADTLTLTAVRYTDVNLGVSGPATLAVGSAPAALPGPIPRTGSGGGGTLVWDSFADLGYGNQRLVQLTVTISDGTRELTATTAPFFVDNGPLGPADTRATAARGAATLAAGDVDGDGRVDAVVGHPDQRTLSLFLGAGQEFLPPRAVGLVGTPAPLAADLLWTGTAALTAIPDAGDLQVGDWIGLPFATPGGAPADPIGPRFFRVTAVAGPAVTIADPHGYGLAGLLPGSLQLGGPVGGAGLTLRMRGLDTPAAALFPDPRPGELAVLPADEDPSVAPLTSDLVVVNRVRPLLSTTLALGAPAGAASVAVVAVAPGSPPRPFEVGQQVAIGSLGAGPHRAVVTAVGPGATLSFQPPLGGARAAGEPVTALDSSAPFLHPGHAANHAFTVLPRRPDGSLGAATLTTPTGGLYPQHLVAADVGAPGGGAPDGLLDLVIVNALSGSAAPGDALRGSVAVFHRNPAAPGFTALPPLLVGQAAGVAATPVHATVADLTGDGLPDIAVANLGESSVSVLVQGPPGTFVEQRIDLTASGLPAGDTISVAAGDVDGDGRVDLAAVGVLSQRLLLLRGADPDGAGPLASFPGGDPLRPTLAVAQSPPPPALVAGAPTTQPAPTLYTRVQPRRLVMTDLNDDGALDLVVPELGNNRTTAFVNRGTAGGTTSFDAVAVTASLTPGEVLATDLDGDRRQDLLVLGTTLSDLSRFHQTTPGTLDAFLPFPVGAEPTSLGIGDLTPAHPGNEVVVVNQGQDSLTVLARTGAGGFAPLAPFAPARTDVPLELQLGATVVPGPYPVDPRTILPFVAAVGDLDHDGLDDLAVSMQALIPSSPQAGAVDVLLSQGGVAPIRSTSRVLLGQRSSFIVTLADLLGADGHLDVALTNIDGPLGTYGTVQVFAGDGTGGFAAPLEVALDRPVGLVAGDLDGDGDADLVVSSVVRDGFHVLVQDPPGALSGPTPGVPAGLRPLASSTALLGLADLDGDGLLDVIFSDFFDNRLGVAFQANPPTSPPTFPVVVPLLSLSQPAGIATGDLDADGLVDVAVTFPAENAVGIYYQRAGPKTPATALHGPIFLPAGASPFDVRIADLDGDGKNDLALTSRGAGTMNVFFQR